MYRIFSVRTLTVAVAWFAVGLYAFGQFLTGIATEGSGKVNMVGSGWTERLMYAIHHTIQAIAAAGSHSLRLAAVPALAWVLFCLLFCNPVWRWLWRKFPSLNKAIFPDLNGEWDVELCSNWPRHLQMLEAAQSLVAVFDIRARDLSELAPLKPMVLRAVIHQTW